jgi:hypothetical protein
LFRYQNCEFIFGERNETHTIVEWSRAVSTCDLDFDFQFVNEKIWILISYGGIKKCFCLMVFFSFSVIFYDHDSILKNLLSVTTNPAKMSDLYPQTPSNLLSF